jgi:4-alpha-glucanotransferase
MPIFSLSSAGGIGTLGKEAYRFVDFLEKAGQSWWQILPINPTNYGDSPYQSFSSYAGNPYFIDPETLIEEKLLTRTEFESYDFGDDETKVDYGK